MSKVPSNVPKRDEYERISYLYQLSNHTLLNPKYKVLSRGYARNATLISKKAVIRLAPNLKRSICKKCDTILIPGLTVTIRLQNLSKNKSGHNDMLLYQCDQCSEIKRFPVGKNPHHEPFANREDVKIPLK